jgi:hypothetical protein
MSCAVQRPIRVALLVERDAWLVGKGARLVGCGVWLVGTLNLTCWKLHRAGFAKIRNKQLAIVSWYTVPVLEAID